MVSCVLVIKDNVIHDAIYFESAYKAQEYFMKTCELYGLSDDVSKDFVLEEGVFEFTNGSVCLSWMNKGS